MKIKKGNLVKMTHVPFLYGIVTSVSWRAVWVWWTGHSTQSGYEPATAHDCMEVINAGG